MDIKTAEYITRYKDNLKGLAEDVRKNLDCIVLSLQLEIMDAHMKDVNVIAYLNGVNKGEIKSQGITRALNQINKYFGTSYETEIDDIIKNLRPLTKIE